MKKATILLFFSLLLITGSYAYALFKPGITKTLFGEINGIKIYEYTLKNTSGMQVKLISYGASITDIITPDKDGRMESVVFGFDSLSGYTGRQNALMGAVVGRVANRIASGKFTLEGKEYTLTANIHGGKNGFDRRIWNVEELKGKEPALKMTYFSKDGEEGFPGNLSVIITYTLTNNNELKIDYQASTDKTTHVNFTNHSYFNLSGGRDATALNTELNILSDQYLEANRDNIPTGKVINVKGTENDFSMPRKIGHDYDLTYVLRNQSGKLALAATAYEPLSGRLLKAYTTEPGLVFYVGNHLNPGVIGRKQKPSIKNAAFCLETQHYPDAANQPAFPGTVLKPGQVFKSQTIYAFSVKKN